MGSPQKTTTRFRKPESRQSTWNYKSGERRKQAHKHYQMKTGDNWQGHWNPYYPETSNIKNYGCTEYPPHASDAENEHKRHGDLNRS